MLRTRISNDRGAALVFLAIILLVLLSMAALAIDLGQLYVAKQRAQNVADAAALAGGRFLTGSTSCEAVAANAADNCAIANNSTFTGAKWVVQKPDGTYPFGTVIGISFPTSFVQDDRKPVTVAEGNAIQASAEVPVKYGFAQVLGFINNKVGATAIVARVPINHLKYPITPWAADKRIIEGDSNSDPPIPPIELGETQTLKVSTLQDPNAFIGPANFLALALGGATGGKEYRERIAGNGDFIEISVDDTLGAETEPGNKVGPTQQGLNDRLSASQFKDDSTSWDSWRATGDDDGKYADDSRIVVVPVVEVTEPTPGRKELTVVGFAAFFIESFNRQDGTVQGKFIEGVQVGDHFNFMPGTDAGTDPNLLDSIRLVS